MEKLLHYFGTDMTALRRALGIDRNPTGGRTAEVERRIAALMGKELKLESPAEEYARYRAMARKVTQ